MGVNGLRELLEPASTEVSILSLALVNCYHGHALHLPYTIGINASANSKNGIVARIPSSGPSSTRLLVSPDSLSILFFAMMVGGVPTPSQGLHQALALECDGPNLLHPWHEDVLNHLTHGPTKRIGRLHPFLAASLPDTFLPLDIIKLYLHLVVTCLLEWEDTGKMIETFLLTILPAVVLKEILLDLARNLPGSNEIDLAAGCTCAAFLSLP
ncbi:hypothetical protein BS17DRAFT_813086 [Gyrodon lividus]|nr:hypothetical protein BS17DRAFT_813086 [Gyrodon lividus]